MNTIPNSWVEKAKKKRVAETAPAFESHTVDSWNPEIPKSVKRFTHSAKAILQRTLRGIRK